MLCFFCVVCVYVCVCVCAWVCTCVGVPVLCARTRMCVYMLTEVRNDSTFKDRLWTLKVQCTLTHVNMIGHGLEVNWRGWHLLLLCHKAMGQAVRSVCVCVCTCVSVGKRVCVCQCKTYSELWNVNSNLTTLHVHVDQAIASVPNTRFCKKWWPVALGNVKLGLRIIYKLNTPTEKAHFELLSATFFLNSTSVAQVVQKMGWKIICELSLPSERAHFKLLNETFRFQFGPS